MSATVPTLACRADIEVLIPTWNGRQRLRRTLCSLRRQTLKAAITVVDNGSDDGTAAMVGRDFSDVGLLPLGRNHGFGPALNRGVERSGARLLVFLNDDAVADCSFVERIAAKQRETGAEMVAGCLLRPDGAIESAGVAVDRSLIAYDLLHGAPYDPADPELEQIEPLAPSGGAGAYLREAFLAVGGFDEEIFAYLEDVELGLRMRKSGMRCRFAPRAFAWHEHSATLGGGTAAKNALLARNRAYLVWKHGAGLPLSARARGALIDGVVSVGKVAIDRNLGAVRGHLAARRRYRRRSRPGPDPRLARVPTLDIGSAESLRRRLGRRRVSSGR